LDGGEELSALEKTAHPEDIKRLSRQIANSACRLEKLLEIGAPACIVEHERRLLAKRIALFPVATGEAAAQADSIENIGADERKKGAEALRGLA
jgi:hypothetical protein